MNSDVMHSRVRVDRNVLEQLVTEVPETVAKDFNVPKPKQMARFTTLHLWNLRRNTRSARKAIRQPRIVTGIGY